MSQETRHDSDATPVPARERADCERHREAIDRLLFEAPLKDAGDAATATDTDWHQVVVLYDQLFAFTPTPIVALNRAIAVGEATGPRDALRQVDGLELDSYYLWHATRGDLLERLGRQEEALSAFRRALELTDNPAEIDLLHERMERTSGGAGRVPG